MPADLTLEVIGGAITAFLAVVLRMAVRFAMSPEGRVILRVLREAGVKAALKARAALAGGISKARAADSEGGSAVTPHERTEIAKGTVDAFIHELDVLGVLEQVAKAFGGVERLEAEMLKRIEERMGKK